MGKYWDRFDGTPPPEEDSGDLYTETLSSEMNLFIKQVHGFGWTMHDLASSGCAEWGGVDNCNKAVFVPLPPEVAKLGREGVNFSCMILGLRNNIWRPLLGGAYGSLDDQVVADVYAD